METCPRCGTTLEQLSLGEASTTACNRCGFANVPVDHESQPKTFESWSEALERFYHS